MAIRLQVIFASFDRVALRWSVEPAVTSPVRFEVRRSGNAETGYETIGSTESVVFIDKVSLSGKFRPTFYQIRAVIGTETVESNVAGLQAPPNDDVLRLQRRERFKLAKYDGVPALLYTRRRTGPPCPRCTPSREEGDMGVDCEICYGTGFKGGYYPPLPIYVANQALMTQGSNLTETHVKDNSHANLWTSNWTIVSPEDVIIEMVPPNHVWTVTGIQRSERRRAAVRQLLTVSEADKGRVVYRLPIPDIQFPAADEIFMFDHADPPRDFDTVFQELIDTYAENQSLRSEAEPTPESTKPGRTSGKRNAATGFYA